MPPPAELTFDFSAPSRIAFGWGRRREAGLLARTLGRRAFIVCGSRTLESSAALDQILQSLGDAGVETVHLETISHEPLVADVDRCVAFLREARAQAGDLLLVVGGGSAIDLAKAAGALIAQGPAGSVLDYLEGVGRGCKIVNTPLPVLAIPTTGGTGSEATKNAVISSYDPPFKKSLRSDLMVPRIVLVDPELAESLPPHLTAWSGMDAITQLIESYVSRRATAATDEIARQGLRLAIPSISDAFHDGRSRPARVAMAQAALLSGIALANSGLGMAHGVAAALGVHCRVPHGLACAVMLPVALRFNVDLDSVQAKIARLAPLMLKPRGPAHERELAAAAADRELAAAVIARIDAFAAELKIPRRLSEIGVRREQLPHLVRDSRGNSMNGNPRDVSDEQLAKILEDML